MPNSSEISHSILKSNPAAKRRNRSEARFRALGLSAIIISLIFLAFLLITIISKGLPAFFQSAMVLDVPLTESVLDKSGGRDPEKIGKTLTLKVKPIISDAVRQSAEAAGITTALDDKELLSLVSEEAYKQVIDYAAAHPDKIGENIKMTFFASGRVDGYLKGRVTKESAQKDSKISPEQLTLIDELQDAGVVSKSFNSSFFTNTDASDKRPETAGVGVALIGSIYMMLVVLVVTVPLAVAAAIYLEEFAKKNVLTDIIEVNIANLAAVPSIVYGILGLSVFINFIGLPKSAPIVGGLVLSLMTLPTIVIATRAAIGAVPPSIREAALGIGASKVQTVFQHVLPLAAPGIMTGTIIGIARALGETAPLLLIGMVAFITTYPAGLLEGGLNDPATALPVQIYIWTANSDPAFAERAWAAIIVLLFVLLILNAVAIYIRKRFERRW